MWFNTLKYFQLTQSFPYSADDLAEKLASHAFTPCQPSLRSSVGFTPPLGKENGQLLHVCNGFLLFRFTLEDKLLPNYVIKEALDKKAQEEAHRQGQPLSRKMKNRLKDDIIFQLLPKAFTKKTHIYGYFDTKEGWLILNNARESSLEILLKHLRQTLPGVSLANPSPDTIKHHLTQWAKATPPGHFDNGANLVLHKRTEDAARIRCQHQDIGFQGVQTFLSHGYDVRQLALIWRDQMAFILQDDHALKSVKFLEVVTNQTEGLEANDVDEATQFDTDFYIMSETVRAMLKELREALGREKPKEPVESVPQLEEV